MKAEEEQKDASGDDCYDNSGESGGSDGELDLDALEAEKQAKKAKKLLPKKVKALP